MSEQKLPPPLWKSILAAYGPAIVTGVLGLVGLVSGVIFHDYNVGQEWVPSLLVGVLVSLGLLLAAGVAALIAALFSDMTHNFKIHRKTGELPPDHYPP